MKKHIIVAMAFLAILSSCNGGGSTVTVAETYGTDTYLSGKLDNYNQFGLPGGCCVMFGDDWIDGGDWVTFFGTEKVKNRGIRGDKAAYLPARVDSIAAKKPEKVLVSAGINDIRGGAGAEETASALKYVFARIRKISPATQLYYLNTVPTPDLSQQAKEEVAKLNSIMSDNANSGKYVVIDLASAMEKGVADGTFGVCDGRFLNGAGYEAYTNIIGQYIGLTPYNHAADKASPETEKYLEGWYGSLDPATCFPSDYYSARLSLFRSLAKRHNSVVLLGDSLTDFGNWEDILPGLNIVNRGIAGDMIEGLKARADEVAEQEPNKIMIMAGCNNLLKYPEVSEEQLVQKYVSLVKTLHQKCPLATIYIQSILPVNPVMPEYKTVNPSVEKINAALRQASSGMDAVFIDVSTPLKDEEGNLRLDCTTDGCHLNGLGYTLWATELLQGERLMVLGDPYELNKK